MKIVHVITTLSHGGAENHVLSLVRRQARAGHELHIIYLKGNGKLRQRFLEAGCASVTKVPYEGPTQILSCVNRLARRLHDTRAQILHTHLLKANALGGLGGRLSGTRCAIIATKHNDERQLLSSLIGWCHGILSWICDDHVIAVSDHVADFVHSRGHVPRHKITRIHNWFDRELYGEGTAVDVRDEFHLPSGSYVFGIVGLMKEQKNHLFLLRAFAKLITLQPEAHLLIVGGAAEYSTAYEERVKGEIRSLQLNDRVTMTGWRDDAFNIIGGLDCLVAPSAWEGFGMVFLEALSQGVPVVATRTGGIPEVVRDGVDGILVESGDTGGLTAAMVTMVKEGVRIAARVRTSGPSYIRTTFPIIRTVEQILDLYETTYARRRTQVR